MTHISLCAAPVVGNDLFEVLFVTNEGARVVVVEVTGVVVVVTSVVEVVEVVGVVEVVVVAGPPIGEIAPKMLTYPPKVVAMEGAFGKKIGVAERTYPET